MLFVPSFHEIGRSKVPWSITPEYFEQELRSLRDAGFKFVSIDQVDSALEDLQGRYCLVTFDDGRRGALLEGLPILAYFRIPAIFYLCTGFINQEDVPQRERYSDFVTWEDAARILDWGHSIGSHGRSHRLLTTLDEPELASELTGSKSEIERRLGVSCNHFAAPFGIMNRREIEQARLAGYATCAAGEGNPESSFHLRRAFVQEGTDLVKLAGRFQSRLRQTAAVLRSGAGPVAMGPETLRVFSRFDTLLCDSEETRRLVADLPASNRVLNTARRPLVPSYELHSLPELRTEAPLTTILLPGKGREPYFVRFADVEEGEAINGLFNHCFGQSRSLEQWRWKSSSREGDDPFLIVAQHGAEIVGEYIALPYRMSMPGGPTLAYQVVDNCILAEHRGHGVQRAMWALFASATIWKDLRFAFGFPGGLALEIGSSRLGYEPLAPFIEMRIELPNGAPAEASVCVRRLERFSAVHQELFARDSSEDSVQVRKSVEYLNWRYLDGPGLGYAARELRTADDELAAVVVYRQEKERATIYDLCIDGDSADPREIWTALAHELAGHSLKYARAVATPSHPAVAFLRSMGAIHHTPDNYTFVFSAGERNAEKLRNLDWRFILGDSDL